MPGDPASETGRWVEEESGLEAVQLSEVINVHMMMNNRRETSDSK